MKLAVSLTALIVTGVTLSPVFAAFPGLIPFGVIGALGVIGFSVT